MYLKRMLIGLTVVFSGLTITACSTEKRTAPQLEDWGETSANGYSAGGETMSLVLEKRPDLFTAYLHCSSRWDGKYEKVVKQQLPIYFAVGEDDEYYGSQPTIEAYQELYELYQEQGLSQDEIASLLVLDIKPEKYFQERGISDQHAGGLEFAYDEAIMSWLFQSNL